METLGTKFIQSTYRQPDRPVIRQKAGNKDKTTHKVSADPYSDFIWSLARKLTNSPEEAEAAVREMQTDIQRCAERGVSSPSNEDRLVALIAWRRLLRFLQ